MKTFKNTLEFKYLFLVIILGVAALTSCKKNDGDVTAVDASAYLMVTNAAEGSAAQDFYLDNIKLNAAATAYTQNTNYFTAGAGNHTAQLTNTGTTTANATLALSLQAGQYYSIYYTGGSSASSNAVVTQDDLSAPASGKAKVRFIHLSSAAASSVDFGINATTKLVTGLAYKAASTYYTVDANTTFFLYAAGSATAMLSIPVTIQAGKIYTIYVSGSTTATIAYHIVTQN